MLVKKAGCGPRNLYKTQKNRRVKKREKYL